LIPIQDVVPTGRVPAATLALAALNVLHFFVPVAGTTLVAPFAHLALVPMIVAVVYLWLFGDNVEARLGRVAFVSVYVAGGFVPDMGAAGGVTAVMGSYLMLLPQSRVYMLVPVPPVLVEVPALFFLAIWVALHLPRFIAYPRSAWMFGLAFVIGAVVARLMRPRMRW
jgi:membrane associated rhomboid family serine protease